MDLCFDGFFNAFLVRKEHKSIDESTVKLEVKKIM